MRALLTWGGGERALASFRIRFAALVLVQLWLFVGGGREEPFGWMLQKIAFFGGAVGFVLAPFACAWALSRFFFGYARWPGIVLAGLVFLTAAMSGEDWALVGLAIGGFCGLVAMLNKLVTLVLVGVALLSLNGNGLSAGDVATLLSPLTPADPAHEVLWVGFLMLLPFLADLLAAQLD